MKLSSTLLLCFAMTTPLSISAQPAEVAPEVAPRPTRGGPTTEPRLHDPTRITPWKGEYWIFATGNGVSSFRSRDRVVWERGPAVFSDYPAWITEVAPDQKGHFWAPGIIRYNDKFHIYYSVSAFGKRTSAIALATNSTLDPSDPDYAWKDEGIVIRTTEASNHNAIDASALFDEEGRLWLAYGSWWTGIKMVELDPASGKRLNPDEPLISLASKPGNDIEAAKLYRRGEYYYLFVNWGICCRGVDSTYNIRIGRSSKITGPYLDKDGIDLAKGGGSLVLGTEGRYIGPGHAGIYEDGEHSLITFHFYDRDRNGAPTLGIRSLSWDEEGWPVVGPAPAVEVP
jgi:arabinan endo-1,5-alpha-L-arabinosidase